MTSAHVFLVLSTFAVGQHCLFAAGYRLEPQSQADRDLVEYFHRETLKLQKACLSDITTAEDWNAKREKYRRELFEMLGLSPLPSRSDLKAQVTGKTEHPQFTVEQVHFQSIPGLYVTANLYVPKALTNRAPTILYLCGHGPAISNGVSYGNKVTYQHHGAWFARNGYVCMIVDSLQLGEIQGLHHGTHRENMWWWNSRGYTPAGVEAWNSIRALDYLETRKEVDPKRFGVTGRSGGGAYSWWIAALDDRIKAAAPVAGITDLQNHVVDGAVEGHCDCMFMVNTYRWDYPLVAALVAPRPLLICNSDADTIFPLDGVVRLHSEVRRIYELYNAADKLGLLITQGPHKDTQDLQLPVFRWFNRHLKGEDPIIEMAATKLLQPEDLRVFHTLPGDSVNTNIHYSFVPAAKRPEAPKSRGEWEQLRDGWLSDLKEKAFRAWPTDAAPPIVKRVAERGEVLIEEFESQPGVPLQIYTVGGIGGPPQRLVLKVLPQLDAKMWAENRAAEDKVIFFAPRGNWNQPDRKQVQIRRRFMLLGQTLDGMRVWDVRRAIQAIQKSNNLPLWLEATGDMAVNCLYASLFETNIARLVLRDVPSSHFDAPDYLNIMRVLDIPETVALAAERARVQIEGRWDFARSVAVNLAWPKDQLVLVHRGP
ncbi:MAG TPA: prolyl oligopeptidase family serine peptidase [Verrucomicrobiae bacterium]|nr:prolyl oligopeptidase family serine peptidase [Verrucomicrobiae bacterium]